MGGTQCRREEVEGVREVGSEGRTKLIKRAIMVEERDTCKSTHTRIHVSSQQIFYEVCSAHVQCR